MQAYIIPFKRRGEEFVNTAVVNAMNLPLHGRSITVKQGSARSADMLYLTLEGDVVSIKYSYEDKSYIRAGNVRKVG